MPEQDVLSVINGVERTLPSNPVSKDLVVSAQITEVCEK